MELEWESMLGWVLVGWLAAVGVVGGGILADATRRHDVVLIVCLVFAAVGTAIAASGGVAASLLLERIGMDLRCLFASRSPEVCEADNIPTSRHAREADDLAQDHRRFLIARERVGAVPLHNQAVQR